MVGNGSGMDAVGWMLLRFFLVCWPRKMLGDTTKSGEGKEKETHTQSPKKNVSPKLTP